MTTMVIDGVEYVERHRFRKAMLRSVARVSFVLGVASRVATTLGQSKARPAVTHLKDHGYTFAAAAMFDAAWFTHSLFSGLLFTALSLMVIEFKLSVTEEPKPDA